MKSVLWPLMIKSRGEEGRKENSDFTASIQNPEPDGVYNLAAAAQQPRSVQTHEFEGQMTEWQRQSVQSVRPSVKEGEPTNDRQVTSIEVVREEGEREVSKSIWLPVAILEVATTPPLPLSLSLSLSLSSPPLTRITIHRIHPVWRQNRRQNRTRNHEGRDGPEDFVASASFAQPIRPGGCYNCERAPFGISITTRLKWRRIRASWDIRSFSPFVVGNNFE